ncbi:unnamed protein product [Rodentolepis nana]|uniref:FH2 domain-containing protein n=1 Tax=Rodentolepis nana TaxID=102285 RepID=A0A158QHU3_RODNA|nr:unnamed protein product [Rodentolepis nana]
MNRLVDLDKLLNDFQEQEAVSKSCAKKYNFIGNKSDDGYACLIGINPTVSKPFCHSEVHHSPRIKEITYLDKSSMDNCTFPESQKLNCPAKNLDSPQQPAFSSTLTVHGRDENQINSEAQSFLKPHHSVKPLSQLTPVDRSAQDLMNYSSTSEAKSDVSCTIPPFQDTSVHSPKSLPRSTEPEQIGHVGEVGFSSREVFPLRNPTDLNEVSGVNANPSRMIPTIEVEPPSIMASPTPHPPLGRRIVPAFVRQRLKDECLLPLQNTEGSSSKSVWPPLVVSTNPELILETDVSEDRIVRLLSSDDRAAIFAITRNLHIRVSISVNNEFWSFISHGLYGLGQEEICLLLRRRSDEALPPIDFLWYYHLLYQLAFSRGRGIETSYQASSTVFPFEHGSCLLLPNPSNQQQNDHEQQVSKAPRSGGGCHGFLFIHAVQKQMEALSSLFTFFPQPPFLFAVVLRSQTEVDLANLQPLRLWHALNLANGGSAPISDRDRRPVFTSDSTAGNSVLSLCKSGGLPYISISQMNILSSGWDNFQGEMRLQILLRRSCHECIRRSLNSAAHGGNLLCLGGDFCPSADCHLAVADSSTGPITEFTPPFSSDRNSLVRFC